MRYLYLLFASVIFFLSSLIRTDAQDFTTRNVTTNLEIPWEILWGPDDNIWMTERIGRISRVNPETGEVTVLKVIDEVYEGFERGLLGMVLHPNFQDTPQVYVVYTYRGGETGTLEKLVRFTYDDNELHSPKTIIDGITGYVNHIGSRLWITGDRKLFMTTGEAGQFRDSAQHKESLLGKILRMNLDGSVPENNPIEGSLVWSWGHRNPQGFVIHEDKIYSAEHGPNTDDEVNLILKGRNYGWPDVKGYCDQPGEEAFCEEHNVVEPLISLYPSRTIAPCGLDFYDKNLIPEWENSLLMAVLKDAMLVQMKLNDTGDKIVGKEKKYFEGQFGRLRDLCISPEGKVYVATSNRDGRGNPAAVDDRIIEITPHSSSVEKKRKSENFSAYPNPADGFVNFNINLANTAKKELKIYNSYGKLINSFDVNGRQTIRWDLKDKNNSKVTKGIYISILKDGHNNIPIKVLIP